MPRSDRLNEPRWRLHQRSSNGGRPNPPSFFVRFAGTFDTRCRCAMSKSSWRSAAWKPITRQLALVQRYGPELEQRLRRHLKPNDKSWRVDETYVRVKGRWCYLCRAIDSAGTTIDFLLSAKRDADAAKGLSRKACAIGRTHSPVSSTQIWHASTTQQSRRLRRKGLFAIAAATGRCSTKGESEPGISRIPGGATDDPGIRTPSCQ